LCSRIDSSTFGYKNLVTHRRSLNGWDLLWYSYISATLHDTSHTVEVDEIRAVG